MEVRAGRQHTTPALARLTLCCSWREEGGMGGGREGGDRREEGRMGVREGEEQQTDGR